MNITILIGNGFDLNMGLKTSYHDFLLWYVEEQCKDDTDEVKNFKEKLKDEFKKDNWSDLELYLGEYSNHCKNIDEYGDIIEDILQNLGDYLELQELEIDTQEKYNAIDFNKIIDSLDNPFRNLSKTNQKFILGSNDTQFNLEFISFNYTTKVIEKIIDLYYRNSIELINIHGTLDDSMLIGLDNIQQIKNKNILQNIDNKDNKEKLQDFIKPIGNSYNLYRRDEKAIEILENSYCIYMYGISLGETDRFWWEKIIDIMLNNLNVKVIISIYVPGIDRKKQNRSDKNTRSLKEVWMNKFLNHKKDLDENLKSNLKQRLLIEINHNIFKELEDLTTRECIEYKNNNDYNYTINENINENDLPF